MNSASPLNSSSYFPLLSRLKELSGKGVKKTMGKLIDKGICNIDMIYASDLVL